VPDGVRDGKIHDEADGGHRDPTVQEFSGKSKSVQRRLEGCQQHAYGELQDSEKGIGIDRLDLVAVYDERRVQEDARKQAEDEFAVAEAKLETAEQELEAGIQAFEKGKKDLEDGRKQLEEAEAELADGWEEYNEGFVEASKELADAWIQLEDGRLELLDARRTIDEMEPAEVFALGRTTNMGYLALENNSDIVEGVSAVFPAFFLLIAALCAESNVPYEPTFVPSDAMS